MESSVNQPNFESFSDDETSVGIEVGNESLVGNEANAHVPLLTAELGAYNSMSASWSGSAKGTQGVPLGWGYMTPAVAYDSINGNYYASIFYSCDAVEKKRYCLYVSKNGTELVTPNVLVLGAAAGLPQPAASYQPPSLFLYKDSLYVLSWSSNTHGKSAVSLDRFGLDGSTGASWVRQAKFIRVRI